MFERLHPGKTGLFIFDNSSGHGVYALVASKFGVRPSKEPEEVPMHDGWYICGLEVVPQKILDEEGRLQGSRAILDEQDVNMSGILGRCKERKQDNTCCLLHLLKSWIKEIVESRGHMVLMLPKYHCKLKIIKYCWGSAKQYTQERCNYTFEGLKTTVPEGLALVSITTMRKWENRFWHYLDAYAVGMNSCQAKAAIKATLPIIEPLKGMLTVLDDTKLGNPLYCSSFFYYICYLLVA